MTEHDLGRATRVFVPCPACDRPLELPLEKPLPILLTCPECGVELRRSLKTTLTLVEDAPRRASA